MASNTPPIIIKTDDGTEAMRVDPSGNVGIGTATPTNPLHVNSNTGIRQNSLYMSGGEGWSSLSYNAHHDGANSTWLFPDPSHEAVTIDMDDAGGAPRFQVLSTTTGNPTGWMQRFAIDGNSGNVLMGQSGGNVGVGTATPNNPLDVNGNSGIRQNRLYMSGGDGWSSLTYNAYHDPSNSSWVFPDPSHEAVTIEMDDNNGIPRFQVWNTTPGDPTGWVQRFAIDGNSGNVLMGQSGASVGIGLTEPRTQLHALGRIASGLDFESAGAITFYPPDGWAWFHIDNGPAGGRTIGTMRFSYGVNPGDNVVMSIDQNNNVIVNGNVLVRGLKGFVQDHPTDPTRQIVYVSLEGGESGTYTRGTCKLEDGKAVIELPEHFSMVTSEDGLSIQLTPRGEWLQLYVVQLTTREVVVQEAQGKSGQFDYLIQGVRKGYEHHEVIREKK